MLLSQASRLNFLTVAQPQKGNTMTLKELRTIVAMLDSMPEETEVTVEINHYGGGTSEIGLETAFMPYLNNNEVKLFTEVL